MQGFSALAEHLRGLCRGVWGAC